MNVGIASGPARPGACTLALVLTTTALTLALGAAAFAQLPPGSPAPPLPKAQPKQQPKAPAQQKPAPAPEQQAGAADQPPLIWSPWTKFCIKGNEENAQQVCLTGRDGRNEAGFPMIAAVLIEPDNDPKKILRVTLPLGMALLPGTRVIIDQGQPMNAPYVACFANGCMADYEASSELVGKMKKGQGLAVQGLNTQAGPLQLIVPLAEFAKANEGPPIDPKVFEERQKKLQEELQKKADEARKKIESQQPPSR